MFPLKTVAVACALTIHGACFAQTTPESSTLGWGPSFKEAKEALPKSQKQADDLAWPDVWKLFKGVIRETGWGPSKAIPAKFVKYSAPGWTFEQGKPTTINLFIGLAYSNKSGTDPADRTQSGENRYTKYISTNWTATFSALDLLGVAYLYNGKSTEDTSGANNTKSFDELIIRAKPDAFAMKNQVREFVNQPDPAKSGEYKWIESGQNVDTVPIKELHLPVIGLNKEELMGAGYLLVRILNGNGASGLTLTAAH